jgi:hypothetical protein
VQGSARNLGIVSLLFSDRCFFRLFTNYSAQASYNYFSNANLVKAKEVPVSPSALGGPRVIEAQALQGSGGLDNLSQPRIRLFLVEFFFYAPRVSHLPFIEIFKEFQDL